ncbi:hypothetical protein [Falsiroseomonas sp. HW251]|uniref:hypothetical protein n=1 Tax=Falsiroseomonas sp. HW251 TaxID=3390998 RepID=UPI003D3227E4
MPSTRFWLAAGGLVVLAFLLRWGLAVLLPTTARPDEIFQTLEPAFRFWFGEGITTWEWREGVRPAIFPGFLAGLLAVSEWLGLGPGAYLALIAATLSLLSVGAVIVAMWFGWQRERAAGAILCGSIVAFWPDLVWLGPKTLTEVQSGNLLTVALGFAAAWARPVEPGAAPRPWRFALIGLLLGLVVTVRFQATPGAAVVAAWACRAEWRERWLPAVAGGLLPVVALGATDALRGGIVFQSVLLHYRTFVDGRFDEFGVLPPYWYVAKLLLDWGASFVIVLLLFLRGAALAPLPALTATVVLLSHSLLAAKEATYIYPALPPMLIVAGLGTLRLARWLGESLRPGRLGTTELVRHATALWILVCGATAASAGARPHWTQNTNFLLATAELRRHSDLCGLVLYGDRTPWFLTGGNSWIGRGVPFYWARSQRALGEVGTAANFALAGPEALADLPGFRPLACFAGRESAGEVCVARTDASVCTGPGVHELGTIPGLGRPGIAPPK